MKFNSKIISAALALAAAANVSAQVTEVPFYFPVAVGGPITKYIDQFATDFASVHREQVLFHGELLIPLPIGDRPFELRLTCRLRARRDDDVAAFFRQLHRHVLTDAAAGARDDRDFTLELLHCVLSVQATHSDLTTAPR